ncbi:cupin domain-containing protein [Streptomyces sp. NPDC048629]|uniref:cupin domain-containing protein n=1 Tax=Streptomyces sp. NPDC048629 TaxID=3154824 RepID=UPI00342FB6C3
MTYVVREEDVAGYSPANHTGTVNRRVIGRETVGAKFVEVLVGTLDPKARAAAHAHPGIEQVVHVLAGQGEGVVDGEHITFGPGDWIFLPEGSMHEFHGTGEEPLRIIVIYSPPYAERPDAAVRGDRPESGAAGE